MYLNHDSLQRVFMLVALVTLMVSTGCSNKSSQQSPINQSQQSAASRQAAAEQTAHAKEALMPAMARVSQRIAAYKSKQGSWQTLRSRQGYSNRSSQSVNQHKLCGNQVTDILKGYKRLHEQLLRERSLPSSRTLIYSALFKLERKDIAYLEGNCPQLASLAKADAAAGRTVGGMSPAEAAMATALATGSFDQIIQTYESMSLAPGQQPAFGMSYKYSIALMKSGREQEARRLLKNLIPQVRKQGNKQLELELLQLQGDLYFSSGLRV